MNFENYKAEAHDLREQLRDILNTLDNLAIDAQVIANSLADLHGELDNADTTAMVLRNEVDTVKKHTAPRIGPKHFRFLAILNEYGDVPREHVARLLGMKETSVDQLACQIRKHHLADLQSRKGTYRLNALGDDVSTNDNFKLL